MNYKYIKYINCICVIISFIVGILFSGILGTKFVNENIASFISGLFGGFFVLINFITVFVMNKHREKKVKTSEFIVASLPMFSILVIIALNIIGQRLN